MNNMCVEMGAGFLTAEWSYLRHESRRWETPTLVLSLGLTPSSRSLSTADKRFSRTATIIRLKPDSCGTTRKYIIGKHRQYFTDAVVSVYSVHVCFTQEGNQYKCWTYRCWGSLKCNGFYNKAVWTLHVHRTVTVLKLWKLNMWLNKNFMKSLQHCNYVRYIAVYYKTANTRI